MAIHRLLGQILMDLGLLTKEELSGALAEQKEIGARERIGKILQRRGCLTPEELAQALAQQLHISYRGDVSGEMVSEEMLALLPQQFAQCHAVLPLAQKDGKLILAMADPTDSCIADDAKAISGLGIERVSVTAKEIEQAIRVAYGKRPRAMKGTVPQEHPLAVEASAVEIVDMLIDHAVREKASDIHIEPQTSTIRVRFRIDGVLRQIFSFSLHMHPALVSRLKIMSALDIAEKRVPQDGRMSCMVNGRSIDLRVSSIPTILGEKVVLRLLDQSAGITEVAHLGLSEVNLALFERMYRRSCGILLAVGPTGSGKSTSLYAVLNALNSAERNIVTIEDPVEYRLEGISQMQIHPKAGLTFARGLRSVLRQDPNIIMVGEIRDAETASIAVRAALTGHLVLSTLHTNNAIGAVERLLDMSVEPFLVASSLTGILAQRLVRRICPHCKERYRVSREAVPDVFSLNDDGASEIVLYRGRGCVKCGNTGYQGRLAIHEVMPILAPMREMIRRGGARKTLEDAAVAAGMRRMVEDGMQKALRGETTVEEVRRVVYADAEGS